MIKKLLFIIVSVLAVSMAANAQKKAPKTAREYFMALPARYFSLDCCPDKNIRRAKEKYLKTYLKVDDPANGYISGEADAAQEGFEMALFKRPNGTYLIGLYTFGEGGAEDTPWTEFIDYANGKFTDVSLSVVKGYDKAKYIYQIPRHGTTIQVFDKDENAIDWYKGKKLYDLIWTNGRFVKSAGR